MERRSAASCQPIKINERRKNSRKPKSAWPGCRSLRARALCAPSSINRRHANTNRDNPNYAGSSAIFGHASAMAVRALRLAAGGARPFDQRPRSHNMPPIIASM